LVDVSTVLAKYVILVAAEFLIEVVEQSMVELTDVTTTNQRKISPHGK
jgi:hypothetical protein